MNEKIYRTVATVGATNIALGIISMVVGLVTGILLVVSGGKLLATKNNITI